MKASMERAVFTVTRDQDQWAVEHDGEFFDHTADKSEALASANKRARQAQDGGHPCQVKVQGETGYFV